MHALNIGFHVHAGTMMQQNLGSPPPMGYYYFTPGQPMAIQPNPPYVSQFQPQQYYQPNVSSPSSNVFMKEIPPRAQPVQYPQASSQSNGEDGHHMDLHTVLKEVKEGLAGKENSWYA
jgi:hypothetical protein